MANGGARQGSGRKPTLAFDKRKKSQRAGWQPAEGSEALREPPDDLGPDTARAIWRAQSPRALHQLTLTDDTAGAFARLCEQWSEADRIYRELRRAKPDSAKYRSGIKVWLALQQRLDASLGRFRLTAYGKPVLEPKQAPKHETNPFVAFGQMKA